jgi:transcriptional regulator with XRE-family HTH domain
MHINKEYILVLMQKHELSQAELARRMNVSRATVSRVLNESRGAGREVIAGIIKAFPDEPIEKLFHI